MRVGPDAGSMSGRQSACFPNRTNQNSITIYIPLCPICALHLDNVVDGDGPNVKLFNQAQKPSNNFCQNIITVTKPNVEFS